MNRTPRSPLSRVGRRHLAALRALVRAHRTWTHALGTPAQTLAPDVPPWVRQALPLHVDIEIGLRVAARVQRRADYPVVAATAAILRERHHHPDRWVQSQHALTLQQVNQRLSDIEMQLRRA